MSETILIVGGGGREHALTWSIAASPLVGRVFVAPGNAGTDEIATNVAIPATDIAALAEFAAQHRVNLTIVGPEVPLAAGIVDCFQSRGLPIFGPSQAAAQLEASKVFAKAFMTTQGIPTASYATFSDYNSAVAYVKGQSWPDGLVVKASGLAAGKGVIVCDNGAEGVVALGAIMLAPTFGAAGTEVVIEERLSGPELSVLALCDGRVAKLLAPARDHKQLFDGGQGPNTGGMGVYGPPADVSPALLSEIKERAIDPVLTGMAARGTPFTGVLFAGLMLTQAGPKVLEYNCRFGDPETQILLPLLESDLYILCQACVAGDLDRYDVKIRPGAAAAVVMTAPGYPGAYPRGLPLQGMERAGMQPETVVFHAGTACENGELVTSGGRVLAVSAYGACLNEAIGRAYNGVAQIDFPGAHYRRDIGR